jgi:hypothetical protein
LGITKLIHFRMGKVGISINRQLAKPENMKMLMDVNGRNSNITRTKLIIFANFFDTFLYFSLSLSQDTSKYCDTDVLG